MTALGCGSVACGCGACRRSSGLGAFLLPRPCGIGVIERPRPRWGFIRPNGTWISPPPGLPYGEHGALAVRELHARGWDISDEACLNRRGHSSVVAELLRRGYVRVAGGRTGCSFGVWSMADLPDDARAEMELFYLSNRCEEVIVDQLVGRPVIEIRPDRGGFNGATPACGLAGFLRR